MKLVLLGAPGSGKGTQARYLCGRLKVPAVSTGDILRKAVDKGNELGKKVKKYMESGELVPDDIVLGLVRGRLLEGECESGFILDGFPRDIYQAEALDGIIEINRALSIEVPDEKILKRMAGRRNCPDCGRTYHIEANPPKVTGKCDDCETKLDIRSDDTPEIMKNRLLTYHRRTEPVKTYYKDSGRLVTVVGQEEVEDTRDMVFEALSL